MGLEASGALTPSQPSTSPNAAALQAQQQQQQQQMASMQQQALRQAAPLAQEQDPFSATNAGQAALIASLAGAPADIGMAQQTIFGTQPQDWFNPQTTSGSSAFGGQGLASSSVGGG
jgi:hypothetical protein